MFHQETILFQTAGRSNYRIPSIIATKDGTVLAFCNDRCDTVTDHAAESMLVYAVKKPGQAWSQVKTLEYTPGWACYIGAAVYDRETDTAFCFGRRTIARDEFGKFSDDEIEAMEKAEEEEAKKLGIHRGSVLFESRDHGESWEEKPVSMTERSFTAQDGRVISHGGSTHGSAHGIQLRHGNHKGRLLCPSRFSTGRYSTWEDAILACYNNAIFSDDHGKTWKASDAVQQGTGEGTLIEDGAGNILYNSRSMHRNQKRLLASSVDGGETYFDFKEADFIFEEKNIGCNASFLRVERDMLPGLPDDVDSLTLFANPRAADRSNMSICISYDSGDTWSAVRPVWTGGSAYSSLDYDPVSRHFYLLYEKGKTSSDPYAYGIAVLEFDLEWLLANEAMEKSKCGTNCAVCKFRERFDCKGCRQMQGQPFWGYCDIYACAENHAFDHCGQCEELPCDMLRKAIENGHQSGRLENLLRWREEK